MSEQTDRIICTQDYEKARYYYPDIVRQPSHYMILDDSGKKVCEVRDVQRHVNRDKLGVTASDYANAAKYLLRAPFKGKELEDLKKARQHIDWLIEGLESFSDGPGNEVDGQ